MTNEATCAGWTTLASVRSWLRAGGRSQRARRTRRAWRWRRTTRSSSGSSGAIALWRYSPGRDPFSLPPEPLPIPPASVNLEPNQGFEAALFLADARLVLLSEANTGPETASGWVGNDRAWDAFSFPLFYLDDAPREPFRPTALAALPGGDVLVLERRYPPLAVRVRRLPGAAFGRTWDLAGTELARLAPPLTVDNFEGLDVAPGPDGELRLFLISDDNDCAKGGHRHGTSGQRTLLLSFSMFD